MEKKFYEVILNPSSNGFGAYQQSELGDGFEDDMFIIESLADAGAARIGNDEIEYQSVVGSVVGGVGRIITLWALGGEYHAIVEA